MEKPSSYRRMRGVVLGFLALWVLGLAGCAGMSNRDASMALIRSDVPLKEAGPNQVTPATSTLRRGDRVFVRRVVGDFAEVETMDRRTGYVPVGVLEEQ